MKWVYIVSGDVFVVGCYDAKGTFHQDSDYSSREQAVQRVMSLNGGKL